jgi:CheY-like chemotaxis protein
MEEGTVFKIYLPWIGKTVCVEKPTIGSIGPLRGTETILLVEDQEAVRELTRSLLADSGYAVLEAERPDKAVDIAQQHSGPIHLLLTDMVMPGMNGRALAERLALIRPEMRALYMSGYTRFTHRELLDFEAPLLTKPFTRDALASKVREVLDTNVAVKSNVDL